MADINLIQSDLELLAGATLGSIVDIGTNVAGLNNTVNDLDTRIDDLSASISSQNSTINNINSRVTNINSSVDELKSKVDANVTQTFDTFDQLANIGTGILPEGEIVYVLADRKHYIYKEKISDTEYVIGSARLTLLDKYVQDNHILVIDKLSDLTQQLSSVCGTGSMVYVKENNTLYYNVYDHDASVVAGKQPAFLEGSTGYFYPISSNLYRVEELESSLSNITSKLKTLIGVPITSLTNSTLGGTNVKGLVTTVNRLSDKVAKSETDIVNLGSNVFGHYGAQPLSIYEQILNLDSSVAARFEGVDGVNSKLTSLGSQVKDLQDEIDSVTSLSDTVANLQTKVNSNTLNLGALTDEVNFTSQTVSNLTTSHEAFEDETTQSLSLLNSKYTQLQNDLVSTNNDLESNINTLNNKCEKLSSDIENLNEWVLGSINDLDEAVNGLQSVSTDLGNKITVLQTNSRLQSENLKTLETKLYTLDDNVAIIDSEVTALQTEVTVLNTKMDALDKEVEDYQTIVGDVSNRITTLESGRITNIEGTLVNLGAQVNTSASRIDDLYVRVTDNRQDVNDLQNDVTNLQNTTDTLSADSTILKTKTDSLTTSLNNASNQISNLNNDVSRLNESTRSLQATSDQSVKDIANLKYDDEELKSKVNDLTTTSNESVAQISTLNTDVSVLKTKTDSLTTSTNESSKQIANLNIQVAELIESTGSLQATSDQSVKDIANLKYDDEELKSKVNDLTTTSNESVTQINSLSTRLNNLQSHTNDIDASIEILPTLQNDLNKLTNEVDEFKTQIESSVSNVNDKVIQNSSKITTIENEYVKKTDLPKDVITPEELEVELKDYIKTDSAELTNIKNSITTNTNAIAEVSDKVDELDAKVAGNTKYFQDEISSTKGMVVSAISGLQHNITKLEKDSADLLDNSIELNSKVHDHTHKLDGGYEVIDGESVWVKGVIEDLSDYKQHVEETYIKPAEVSGLLNNYSPDVSNKNKWVGTEVAKDLVGKTGEEIALERHSYNSIFDQIIFADYEPTTTTPSTGVALKDGWDNKQSIDWYDEDNKIILVKAGSVGPDGTDFYPTNIKDSIISYPEKVDLDNHYTNGVILKSDEKQTCTGFCRIQTEDGSWDYYKKEGTIYHVPPVLEAGEYRYYMAAYFTKGSPVINNSGLSVKVWNENEPVESDDYITIIASKPVYYNTPSGEIENPLVLWGSEMTDFIELLPSCQCNQQFRVPRKLKKMYIWNDLAGDYSMVPMVHKKDEQGKLLNELVPAYMIETISDGYYNYSYDFESNGHRGGIKIKLVF